MLSMLRPIGAGGLGSGGTGSGSSGWIMAGNHCDSPLGAYFGMSSTSPSYRILPPTPTPHGHSVGAASPHGMANLLSTQAVSPSTHVSALPLSFYGIVIFAANLCDSDELQILLAHGSCQGYAAWLCFFVVRGLLLHRSGSCCALL